MKRPEADASLQWRSGECWIKTKDGLLCPALPFFFLLEKEKKKCKLPKKKKERQVAGRKEKAVIK